MKTEQTSAGGKPVRVDPPVGLVERLRDTPNWLKESYGSWKDCVTSYDRAPFEAADEIERLRAFVAKCAAVQNDEGWQGAYWREARALLRPNAPVQPRPGWSGEAAEAGTSAGTDGWARF